MRGRETLAQQGDVVQMATDDAPERRDTRTLRLRSGQAGAIPPCKAAAMAQKAAVVKTNGIVGRYFMLALRSEV